jgi:hypothetical protein
LGSGHSSLGHFGYIQISEFVFTVFCAKNIRTFEVAMENLNFVKGFESFGHLDHGLPNLDLVEESFVDFMVINFLLDVSGVGKLHNDAKSLGFFIKESFFIIDDIGMGD